MCNTRIQNTTVALLHARRGMGMYFGLATCTLNAEEVSILVNLSCNKDYSTSFPSLIWWQIWFYAGDKVPYNVNKFYVNEIASKSFR